jgi:DMSO/TMAO reductase YedYZ molybdopterin-dependent catalytic subunit
MRTLDALPVFKGQNQPAFDPATWRLVVDGAVGRRLALTHRDLLRFPRASLESDFRCHEGWVVPNIKWEGVRIAPLLTRAQVLPEARFLTVHAGDYTIVLSLAEARHPGVLLATTMNGQPLPPEHGAPVRLVVPADWDCFSSVKWVQRLELTERRAAATGPTIALTRIGQRGPAAPQPGDGTPPASA